MTSVPKTQNYPISDLFRYKSDLVKEYVTGEYFLAPGSEEVRSQGYDEYFHNENCLFENATIYDIYAVSDANFHGCTFRNCEFIGGSLTALTFIHCTIESLIFRDTKISCSFENSTVRALHFFNG